MEGPGSSSPPNKGPTANKRNDVEMEQGSMEQEQPVIPSTSINWVQQVKEQSKEELSLMEQVFSNTLVLQEILANVQKDGSIEFKQLRLVSKLWNEIIVSLPIPRLCLVVNSVNILNGWDPQVFIDFVTNGMNPKLARRVGVATRIKLNQRPILPNANLPDYEHDWKMESVGYRNLVECIRRFSDHIMILDLSDTFIKVDFVRVLHILLNSHCPNLIAIMMDVNGIEESKDGRNRPAHVGQTWKEFKKEGDESGIIAIKQKLKTIRIKLSENDDEDEPDGFTHQSGPLHKFYRALVKASPNLIGIKQKIMCFPDISTVAGLRSMNFDIQLFRTDFEDRGHLDVNLDLDDLSRMIAQASETLKYLRIKSDHFFCSRYGTSVCACGDHVNFHMPTMRKLKVLRCTDVDIFLKSVNSASFFNANVENELGHVEIGRDWMGDPEMINCLNEISAKIGQGSFRAMDKVSSLIIHGVSSLESIGININIIFPRVRNLTINSRRPVLCTNQDAPVANVGNICYVYATMPTTPSRFANALQIAQLVTFCENYTVTVSLPNDFESFVQILFENIAMFNSGGIRNLSISGTGTYMNMTAAKDHYVLHQLETVLMSMKQMESVRIINSSIYFPWRVEDRIQSFIVANNLPVVFLLRA